MTNSGAPTVVKDETARFPSLASMRAAHTDLLRRYHEQSQAPETIAQIETFIRRGKATGALLDAEADRVAAQTQLDYWTTRLYRPGYEPPDATLDEFDSSQLAATLDEADSSQLAATLDEFDSSRLAAKGLWKSVQSESPVFDLHIHPAMNRLVIKQNLNVRQIVSRSFNPFAVRASWPKMKLGGYSAILSILHVPERGLIKDFPIIKLFKFLRPDLWRKLMVGSTFDVTLRLMNDFEQVIASAAPVKAQLAKSVTELNAILSQPSSQRPIAVVHAIEGAHSLGLQDTSDENIFRHLETFYQRGVAYLTLAHFYPNRITHPCYPFPEDFANLAAKRTIWRDLTLGLTDLGKRVVGRMIELGMLIDISHCTPIARKQLFDLADASGVRVPFLATHVGAYEINPSPYNLQDWEIKRIARDGGIVGVIFMPYWLTPHGSGQGINYLAQTLKHFVNVAGEDSIGIGTDFDGFTTPPEDLKDASEMPRLTQRLQAEGYTLERMKKILGGNALRVVREGWGKK